MQIIGQNAIDKHKHKHSEPYAFTESSVDHINKNQYQGTNLSLTSMAIESEVFAGNGPPQQSLNQSDYSLLKNLVDKAVKSPSSDISEVNAP